MQTIGAFKGSPDDLPCHMPKTKKWISFEAQPVPDLKEPTDGSGARAEQGCGVLQTLSNQDSSPTTIERLVEWNDRPRTRLLKILRARAMTHAHGPRLCLIASPRSTFRHECRHVGVERSGRAARVQYLTQRQRSLPRMKPSMSVLGSAPDRAPTSRVLVTSSRSPFRRTTACQRVEVDSSWSAHARRRRVSSPPSADHSVATGC